MLINTLGNCTSTKMNFYHVIWEASQKREVKLILLVEAALEDQVSLTCFQLIEHNCTRLNLLLLSNLKVGFSIQPSVVLILCHLFLSWRRHLTSGFHCLTKTQSILGVHSRITLSTHLKSFIIFAWIITAAYFYSANF